MERQLGEGSADVQQLPETAALAQCIQRYLQLCIIPTAIFLAERLYAAQASDEHLHLLATCYMRSGNLKAAHCVLASSRASDNRYLYAVCCLELDKLAEGEMALLSDLPDVREKGPVEARQQLLASPSKVPNGAAGLLLLGRICQRGNRKQHAVEYFKLSLQMDRLLWGAFEALCQLQDDTDATEFFGPNFTQLNTEAQDAHAAAPSSIFMTPGVRQQAPFTPLGPNRFLAPSAFRTPRDISNAMVLNDGGGGGGGGGLFMTPNLTPIQPSESRMFELQTPMAFSPLGQPFAPPQPEGGQQRVTFTESATRGVTTRGQACRAGRGADTGLRGANKQLSFSSVAGDGDRTASRPQTRSRTAAAGGGGGRAKRKMGAAKADDGDGEGQRPPATSALVANGGLGAMPPPPGKEPMGKGAGPMQQEKQESDAVVEPGEPTCAEVLPLLSTLGTAYQLLCHFRCRDALDILHRLPPEQFLTGWVQHCIGRAHFEMADYPRAKQAFELMQKVQPHRVAGLELLSTALWHLKADVDLCFLAQKVSELDRKSAQSWCVLGNCFSLQKEHETALKFFQRAIQVDPMFTYAYTLCGHEYVCNEDFEKAISCYRYAVRLDERHYNAWYGLGTIYFRQEKYELAEYHFTKALSINQQSSVLHCYLGMVLSANKKFQQALDMLDKASNMEPRNPQARYQRANVLLKCERLQEALGELEKVRDYAPRESSVHYLMGKICKRLGRTGEALRHFVAALDLDPKDSNLAKVAIERLDEPELEDEEDKF